MKKNNAKKNIPDLERYEAVFADPPKPKPRLPRMGCFLVFFLFLFIAGALATGYYHSAGETPVSFDIPEGRVTVSDPESILLEEDQAALEAIAKELSQQADCSVAVLFPDMHFANMMTVYKEIAADWAPEKGVLLLCDARNGTMRFGLLGSGWRIADWDVLTVMDEMRAFRSNQRGAQAFALLTRLKRSLDAAAKIPETTAGTEPENKAASDAAQQPERKSSAAMTDEDIEAEVAALEKAEAAKAAAEDRAAEEALDEDFDDDMSVGMRAYAEKNKNNKPTGILYSDAVARGDEGTARNYALVFLAITGVVAAASLSIGKKTRVSDLKKGPKVIKDFKKMQAGNSSLRLVDMNEYDSDRWLHKGFLKFTAVLLGILFGLGFVSSTITEPVAKDAPRRISSMIPEYPENGRIVDQAEVFSSEGRAKLAAAIAHLEAQTGGEMMVFTVKTINGMPIEEFSLDAATKWKIGKHGKDNGALFVLVVNDHKNRIEIGYGWEGAVNDARAGDLLRQIKPDLRAEQYAEAAIKVVRGIESYVTGKTVTDETGTPAVQVARETFTPEVKTFDTLSFAKPEHDPRVLNPADSAWGLLGVFGSLIALLIAFWGRIVGTSVPHLVIYDPSAVRSYSSSGGSGGSSSSRSYSSSSSSSSSGGGGSFGGGGASGSW